MLRAVAAPQETTLAPVILVGYRRQAMAAALPHGPIVLVVDRTPPRSARAKAHLIVHVDFRDPKGGLAKVCEALGGERPRGVVALIERSVAMAAEIAERFDLPGIRPPQADLFRDKVRMKERARAVGIRTAAYREVSAETTAGELVAELGLPLVVKPRSSSGSRNLVIAKNLAEVRAAIKGADSADLIAEELVKGVEMSVESLVAGGSILFTNPSEYLIQGFASIVPAGVSAAHRRAALELNAEVLRAFGIADGITHLELFITQDGYVLGEVAARPPGGYLMDLIAGAYGFDPYDALISISCGEAPQVPAASARPGCAAALIIHPGVGEVVAVSGLETVKALPGVERVQCSLRPGDVLGARRGVGESKGWVLFLGADRPGLLRAIRQVQGLLDVELRAPTPRVSGGS